MSVLAIGPLATSAASALAAYVRLAKDSKNNETLDGVNSVAASSIIEMGKLAEMEFITVIDSSLTSHDSVTDVLKYINSLCAGWILSAASVNTSVGSIKTVKLLGMLNPSKSPSYAIANTLLNGAASAGFADNSDDFEFSLVVPASLPKTVASLEDNFTVVYNKASPKDPAAEAEAERRRKEEEEARSGYQSARVGNDLATVQNLSVGQMVTLAVSDGRNTKDVNITVRLVAVPTAPKLLSTILSWSQKDNRLKSRVRAWRTGELRFWRDVVFMRDIFTERKRLLMNDNSDLLTSMLGRSRDSMVHSVLTATPSVGTMSSVVVIDAETLMNIERKELDGRLKDFRFRQRIMNATGVMLIVVVDPLSELVTVYTHTKSLASEFSIRQMKAASKGGSTDINEILKLMNQNSMASF